MPRPSITPFWAAGDKRGKSGHDQSSRYRFVDVTDKSRWFDALMTASLEPGESDGCRVFDANSTAETWYYVASGTAEFVQPDGTVEILSPYDAIYFRPGTGGELRAPAGSKVSWFALSCDGGKATAFSATGGRGAGTLRQSEAAKPADIFRRIEVAPRNWPGNSIGASPRPWWFYSVDDRSKWFRAGCIGCLPPGGATALHSHLEEYEGPYESWYIILSGTGMIRNEYEDYIFEGGPAGAFVPANASHQLINNGTDFLWVLTTSSRGTEPLRVDTYSTPAGTERPGYLEEYNRIIAARRDRGLPVP